MAILLIMAAIGAVGYSFYLVNRAAVKHSSHLQWHFITAIAWTLITLIAGFIQIFCKGQVINGGTAPTEINLVGNLLFVVAGWNMISCWGQLQERCQGERFTQQRRGISVRLYIQSLWGPMAVLIIASLATSEGQRCFSAALARRDLPTALFLREYGIGTADMYFNGTMRNDLTNAVRKGDVAGVSAYLAVVDKDDYIIGCLLNESVQTDHGMITEQLLQNGCPVNELYPTATDSLLHLAVKKGKVNQVRTLLRHGASLSVVDQEGRTPLQVAEWFGNEEIIDLLKHTKS